MHFTWLGHEWRYDTFYIAVISAVIFILTAVFCTYAITSRLRLSAIEAETRQRAFLSEIQKGMTNQSTVSDELKLVHIEHESLRKEIDSNNTEIQKLSNELEARQDRKNRQVTIGSSKQ